jgi:hypothetical protein
MKPPPPTELFVLAALQPDGTWHLIAASFDAARIAKAEQTYRDAQRLGPEMPAVVGSYRVGTIREVRRGG